MTRTRLAGTVFSVAGFVPLMIGFSTTAGDRLHSAVPTDSCVSINVTASTDELISELRDNGWISSPSDNMEALYHPNCIH